MTPPRPRYHFTPPENFMNDPNGLVFYDGEYHLFYQYNPFGDIWGHMSWGHAVSRDLLHWDHLPVALHEENDVMIFSGSAVIDWQNTSGFGTQEDPPMIALYTGHSDVEETQNFAYSTNRGRTWTKYEGNPVSSIGSKEFRDPKVFWHTPTQKWIMVTALADQHKVRFDCSSDLKHWSHLSDFGPAGAVDGYWECPDLFPLSVDHQPGRTKWVLKVDALKGTGAQYFIGDFDGTRFLNKSTDERILRVDHGQDFYAAQSWNDEPKGRRIWIGWLNNWHYANAIPTAPWRGSFSIPRELRLRKSPQGPRLVQCPIEELQQLRQPLYRATNTDIAAVNTQLGALKMDSALEIKTEFLSKTSTEFGIKICAGDSEETVVGYDTSAQELFVDRRESGISAFSDRFAGTDRARLGPEEGKIGMDIFLDSCSVEVFGNDGNVVISDLIFPTSQKVSLEIYANGGSAQLNTLEIWQLGQQG